MHHNGSLIAALFAVAVPVVIFGIVVWQLYSSIRDFKHKGTGLSAVGWYGALFGGLVLGGLGVLVPLAQPLFSIYNEEEMSTISQAAAVWKDAILSALATGRVCMVVGAVIGGVAFVKIVGRNTRASSRDALADRSAWETVGLRLITLILGKRSTGKNTRIL